MNIRKSVYLLLTFLIATASMADTKIVSKSFNPFSGSLVESVSKVKDGKIRVERAGKKDEYHEIIDVASSKQYLINHTDNSVIVDDVNRKSDYQDKAELIKLGEGPSMLDGYDTTHYIFRAGNVDCNHVYISKINYPDIDDYLKTFTMVPVKVAGMMVSSEEKACQKAARDAAKEIKKMGVPLLVKGKNDQETLFTITQIYTAVGFQMKGFEPDSFVVPDIENAQSAEDSLKKNLEAAMEDAMYIKVLERIEQQDMPIEEKNRIKEEARMAHEKGEFMQFLENKANEEKKKQGKAR